jgi:hypothetical protein
VATLRVHWVTTLRVHWVATRRVHWVTFYSEIARFRGGTSTDLSRAKLLTDIEQKLHDTEVRSLSVR